MIDACAPPLDVFPDRQGACAGVPVCVLLLCVPAHPDAMA
jgi:hypothetical protein